MVAPSANAQTNNAHKTDAKNPNSFFTLIFHAPHKGQKTIQQQGLSLPRAPALPLYEQTFSGSIF
jgi:hypothetical protein